MTTLEKPIKSYESVQVWLESYARFWGSALEEEESFETLARFCDLVNKDPDGIIGDCLRPQEEGDRLLLSTRARRRYIEQIQEFERQEGSRHKANIIRSFFIHNGVAMNPSILR